MGGCLDETEALWAPGVRVRHVFGPGFPPDARVLAAALAAGRVEAAQGLIRWLASGPAQAEFLRRGFLKP